jgi:thioredoxin-dependent peroxiredoxin
VSADDQATAERFRAALELPYPLVGDKEGRILKAWGVRIPVLGLARRVSFVIGRDRRVESVHESAFDPESHVAAACAFVGRKAG